MSNVLSVVLLFAGLMLALSFLFIKLDREKKKKDMYAKFEKMAVYKEFLDLCTKLQKGKRISRAQMAESIKIMNDLSKGRLYQFIYKKQKVWGQDDPL